MGIALSTSSISTHLNTLLFKNLADFAVEQELDIDRILSELHRLSEEEFSFQLRSLDYALKHQDQSHALQILIPLLLNFPRSSLLYYLLAQMSYGNRAWKLCCLALRYALAYGSKDAWLGGVLGGFLITLNEQRLGEQIAQMCKTSPFEFTILSTEDQKQIQDGLRCELSPLHQLSYPFLEKTPFSQKHQLKNVSTSSKPVFRSNLSLRLKKDLSPSLPNWLDSKSIASPSSNLSPLSSASVPSWLERQSSPSAPASVLESKELPAWLETHNTESTHSHVFEAHHIEKSSSLASSNPQPSSRKSVQVLPNEAFESLDPLRQELRKVYDKGVDFPLGLALQIPPPCLYQPQSPSRQLQGSFLISINPNRLFLIQEDQSTPPLSFPKSSLETVDLSTDGLEVTLVFQGQRRVQFDLSSWPKHLISSLNARLNAWLVNVLDFDDLL